MSFRRALPWCVLLYFVTVVLANAYLWHEELSLRAIEYRRFDYEWELQLPWRAAKGEWSAFDFAYPVGPLWQLLAWCGAALLGPGAEGLVAGQHVVFPLASLVLCATVASVLTKDPMRRAAMLFALCVLALHDDVRSFRAVASLVVIIAYVPVFSPGSHSVENALSGRRSWLRPGLSACAWFAAGLLSFDNLILGLISLAAMFAAEVAATRAPRAAVLRLGRTLAVATALAVAFGLALSRFGNGPAAFISGMVGVVRDYTITQADDAGGFSVAGVVLFITLASLPALLFMTRRFLDATTAMWLAGALPGVFRGVLRSDPEHVYSATLPLVAVLCLVCVRDWGKHHFKAAWSGLLASIFILGWFGGHRERPSAWQPTKLARALTLRWSPASPGADFGYQGDLQRVIAWMRAEAAAGAQCITVPHGMGAAHPLADVDGPNKNVLRWSASRQREVAEKLRRTACPRLVMRLDTFDWQPAVHQWALGPDFVARAQYYEPVARLGPAVFGAKLRDVPLQLKRTPIHVAELLNRRQLSVPGSLELSFERPIPEHHMIEIAYELHVPTVRRLLGGMPWLEVEFFAGEESLGPRTLLAGLEVDHRTVQVIAPVPEAAEWHWYGLHATRRPRGATRMVIHTVARDASARRLDLRVHGLSELSLSEPAGPKPAACESHVDLTQRAARGFGRFTVAATRAQSISLPPNPLPEPPAELFLPVRACEGSCVFAEVSRDSPAGDGTFFDMHVVDGPLRPREVRFFLRPGDFTKTVEVPMSAFADRETLVRFGVDPGDDTDGDTVRIERPVLAPCQSRKSLIQELHQDRLEVARGLAAATVDGLTLSPEQRASAPVDARLGVEVKAGDCLAFTLAPETQKEAGVAIEVSVLESDVVRRLLREEFRPGNVKPRRFKDVPLEQWKDKWIKLRFSAWPLGLGEAPRAQILRPRLHTCGRSAPWGRHGG
jgi:hypothetical protein